MARIDDVLVGAVTLAVVRAPAYAAADAAATALARQFHAAAVVIWQVDYVMRELHPVSSWPADGQLGPTDVTAGELGAVFTRQEPTLTPADVRGRLLIPLTCRGHRIGVVELHGPPGHWASRYYTALRCVEILAPLLWEAGRDNDVQERRRRSSRLSLPAEMQWQVLPPRGLLTQEFGVYAQLEPAHLVASDLYDWSYDGATLSLAVLDATGENVAAAQVSELAMTALRNARRAQLPFGDCVSLADQAVYDLHRGRYEVDALLIEHDPHTGQTTVIQAGSPQLLLLVNGNLTAVDLPRDPPLGSGESTPYRQHSIALTIGDAALMVSDGALTAQNSRGDEFGVSGIDQVLHAPGLPDWDVPRAITAATRDHVGALLPDDASVLILRRHAPPMSRPS